MKETTQVIPVRSKHDAEDNTQSIEDTSSDNFQQEDARKVAFFGSIKMWLILIISVIVLLTVFILSAIWLSSFIPSVVEYSKELRDFEFDNIVAFVKQTIREVKMTSETGKHLMMKTLDFSNRDQIEVLIYQFLKQQWTYLKGLVVTNHIGDNEGRSSTPDIQLGFFDLTILINAGNAHPGKPTITNSFIDASQPQYTFITMVNSIELPQPDLKGNKFKYYLGTDLSAETISQYLAHVTLKLSGSKSFIIEMATQYIIANDNSNARVAVVNSDGSVTRQTYLKIDNDERVSSIAKVLASELGTELDTIGCGNKSLITSATDYISVYRLCTDTDVDWLFVLAVPQWNYISSIVIAVVCATLGACIIISAGVITSVIISVKLVKPFYNLIDLFESVSHMDLDNLVINDSKFTEVKHLQNHFKTMTDRIKLYRAFIPSHLLSQLDQGGDQVDAKKKAHENDSISMASSHKSSQRSSRLDSKQSSLSRSHASSSHRRYSNDLDIFSLHLDRKKLSIVAIHIEGLNRLFSEISAGDCVDLLKDFFDHLGLVCRTSNGYLGNFENDLISISFNASSNQSKHSEKAAAACVQLMEKLNTTKSKKWPNQFKKKPHLIEIVTFRFAICVQESLCGNLGSNDFKNFTVISSAKFNLESMLDVASKLNLNIVLSDRVFANLEEHYQMRYVYTKELIPDSHYSSPFIQHKENERAQIEPTHIYELGESLNVGMDEWMYELQEKEKKAKWTKYNQACKLFFSNQFEEARELFREFHEQNNDVAAELMIKKCSTTTPISEL
ncbi:predicted protein [Naegleria gruberi]|uniref:Predicted protein n=1 Tax=Naegleria gruberi TaxID=5762 RepID=D2V3S1_NAEGR|nr:uncharacterized protein NAEGRDRAFT_63468 [Naegleria gruberi]EFC48686.1 predicted protein [Naegleria gruberi]|eukprot:XP_002681430.1 predicted protein [Naegleria gruberi strain NEG-M]